MFNLDIIINTLWYCIGLQWAQWKVFLHYHTAVRQANRPRKENSQACFKTLESLAYDFYDDSFKTDCIFLVQSFTFYQALMVSGSCHPHPPSGGTQQKILYREAPSRGPYLTYLYTIFWQKLSYVIVSHTFHWNVVPPLIYIPINWKSPCRHSLPWEATEKKFVLEGSAPRSNPSVNFYTLPFPTRKGLLSLTLPWNMLLYSWA